MFARARKLAGHLAPIAIALVVALAPAASWASEAAPDDSVAVVVMQPDTSTTMRPPESPAADAFPVTLAAFATTLVGSAPERTANIRLAAQALDGAVVDPGGVLSFNRVVGPRTVERGYQLAPVILHERRQVQAGGGVCQAASTLFVAALTAGLSATERWRHSSPVDYIALGQDATIAWGAKDLKLRNDLDVPVRVRCELIGTTLAARIEAVEQARHTYELVSEEHALPADPGVAASRPGREIELYRVRRDDGAETSRELVHRDVFPPSRGSRPEER